MCNNEGRLQKEFTIDNTSSQKPPTPPNTVLICVTDDHSLAVAFPYMILACLSRLEPFSVRAFSWLVTQGMRDEAKGRLGRRLEEG